MNPHTADPVLVAQAQQGDRAAAAELVRRYTDVAYAVASRFYMPGGDRDDVRQEALLGIVRAIRTFREGRGVPFCGFVRMAVYRWLVTTCTQEPNRQKHRPLNESERTIRNEEGELDAAVAFIEDARADVPALAEQRAELYRIVTALRSLSPLEARCVVAYALGFSYEEIGVLAAATPRRYAGHGPVDFKGVDNAMQRGRRKLRRAA